MAQVWLVTGSSRGLGHAIVEAGLGAGNKVLATARDIKSLADLSERYGGQVELFALDVTDETTAANASPDDKQAHDLVEYLKSL
jgi:NADP-dependent 3-hydroxy acid dehydrogenase YdfG